MLVASFAIGPGRMPIDAKVSQIPPDDAEDVGQKRRRLYSFLDELKRGELELGPSDYARIDRLLILLKNRGIDAYSPEAAFWFAPLLCATPAEQAAFHSRYQALFGDRTSVLGSERPQASKSSIEIAAEKQPQREASLRRWLVVGVGVALAILLALALIFLDRSTTSFVPSTVDKWVSPDVSTPLLNRPIVLLPLALLAAFLLWRRSRKLVLLRAFAPSTDRSEKVALATSQSHLYAEPGVRRAFGAFRRHWASLGGPLHIRRSIRATMRAGGRPELHFGTRPRTPEYTLLVDCETPRDHASAAATVLLQQLIAERVIVTRYDYFGDPRRLTPAGTTGTSGAPMRLADVAGLHAGQTILILSDAHTFCDSFGIPFQWVAALREWGHVILLTPRSLDLWDWAERELSDLASGSFQACLRG